MFENHILEIKRKNSYQYKVLIILLAKFIAYNYLNSLACLCDTCGSMEI